MKFEKKLLKLLNDVVEGERVLMKFVICTSSSSNSLCASSVADLYSVRMP